MKPNDINLHVRVKPERAPESKCGTFLGAVVVLAVMVATAALTVGAAVFAVRWMIRQF